LPKEKKKEKQIIPLPQVAKRLLETPPPSKRKPKDKKDKKD